MEYSEDFRRGAAWGLRQGAEIIERSIASMDSTKESMLRPIQATGVAWATGLRIAAKMQDPDKDE